MPSLSRRRFLARLAGRGAQPDLLVEVRGAFAQAVGGDASYRLGEGLVLHVDPRLLPALKAQADRLVGGQAAVSLGP